MKEIYSAQSRFKELIEYDDSILEAHRGYIKCAAVLGQIDNILPDYNKRIKQNPSDAAAIYSAALCLTYYEDKQSLEKAEKLLLQAIELDKNQEYFYQTLGYVIENLETVYKKTGNLKVSLESALEAYKTAWFLNDNKNNPENAANLLLNMGNVCFLLGQFDKALAYYNHRIEITESFEDENTEIMFYRHLGTAAFQSQSSEKAIKAFNKVIDLIDSRINPLAASDSFELINRFITDRIISPALKPDLKTGQRDLRQQSLIKQAKYLAVNQSEIYRQVTDITRAVSPVLKLELSLEPESQWTSYRDKIKILIKKQKDIFHQVYLVQEKNQNSGLGIDEVKQTLAALAARVESSLNFPEHLIQLKAEMIDRLGLAYQEDGKWEKAVNCFEKVFQVNKELGLDKNLAVNKRSSAYNKYQMAENLSGLAKKDMLEASLKDFLHVLDLIKTNGVPDKNKSRAGHQKDTNSLNTGVFNISLQQSLTRDNKTQAAFGFSEDQEIRLAKAFISRINTELGDLIPAEAAIKEQLAQYPENTPIAENDKYGVALLYHRAGHLSFARGKTARAFEQFYFSAKLSLQMENPVSSGINVSNTAHVLLQIPADTPDYLKYKNQVEALDTAAGSLLLKSADTAGAFAAAEYYNKMGVYYSSLKPDFKENPAQKASRFRFLQKAGIHFTRGINLLEKENPQDNPKYLNLLSMLYLNMAYTALNFGESESAKEHFKTALKYSLHGRFPEIQWRAYAGLGLMDKALESLEKITLFRAGCKKGEILNIFGEKVIELVNSGRIEEAFNLGEKLSELERFNYLAQFTGLAESESLYRSLYPNLKQISGLREKLSSALKEDQDYLKSRLEQELLFVKAKMGKDLENLPDVLRLMLKDQGLEQVLMLLGAGAAAQAAAKNFNPEYDRLIEEYHKIRKQGIASRPENRHSDIFAFLGPEPYEAVDIMENMDPGKTMIRLLKIQDQPNQRILVFYLTPDDLKAEIIDQPDKIPFLEQEADQDFYEKYYVVYENPEELPGYMAKSCALSGSHFMRSVINKKPFKTSLLCLAQPFLDFSDKELIQKIQGINTLILPGKVSRTASIPVRTGNIPEKFISLETDNGRQINAAGLFAQASNLSLAIMENAEKEDSYILGHMTSLYQCPSLMICDIEPVINPDDNEFLKTFLKSYPETTAFNALQTSENQASDNKTRFLLGYRGMNMEESLAFASDNFIQYIKQGQAAYKQGESGYALIMFENAIMIANEIREFNKYLINLFEYARESAYKAGDYKKSLEYAQKSLDLIEAQKPDSENHAEAVLKLGLIHARMENYEQAMPLLEEAVEIMTALELGPRLISALEESGIVLENAAEYEQAAGRFQSAASLSETLMKDSLLARQFEHLGRIYDMRLSSYAAALQNYQKALEIYQDMEEVPGTAQSLLNIGRAYRLLGNFPKADQFYAKALETIEPLKISNPGLFPEISAKIIIEQANNAWYQGRYQEAFEFQQKAYSISKNHDLALLEIITLNTSGLIWWTLGDQEKALFELNKALEKARDFNKRKDEIATCLNNIGLVYRETGQYEKAVEKFDSALVIDKKIKSRWAIAYDLRNKAIALLLSGRASEALPLFQAAAKETREIGNRINEAKSLLGLGQANAVLGNTLEAKTALNKALDLSKSMFIRETWWRTLFELAKLEQNKAEAEKILYQAVNVIEDMRAEIKIEQLRDNFITNKMEVYETLAVLLADMGKVSESFEIAERSRARNFIDILGNHQLKLNNNIDQELLEKQAKIRDRIKELESLAADTSSTAAGSSDTKALEIYKQSTLNMIESLKNDLKNLNLGIQAKNPQMASLVSVEPVKVSDIYKLMKPGLVLISYYVLPQELFCWRISSQDIKLFRIPIDINSLSSDILDFRTMIQNLEPLEDMSEKLSSIILKPIISDLEDIEILGIIPHKMLHYLSFAALAYENDYLVDHTPLFYLPSASILDITLSRRLNNKNTKVLAIGNPDLEDPVFDLPFSEHEVASIQWNFPDITTKTRKDASEAWLSENIEKFGIIHLASHGEFDPVNPLFSAVRLAKHGKSDGNLEAREVFGLNINADMVVLSACQTGLGKITRGDDVIGLNRSFLYAGTHTIISSLWRVSDISSAILLKQFYRHYTKYDKAASLRKAVLDVKNQYPHPGYWGAFTLVGDFK
ncbi:Tetratricopeptide repeat-containing protein [Desulfonema limicola]|uniref:Tetratricopeptide repeat-containing protein n=1 Tax=Desulfonema limicola TaxID=45656 RepID=A0A975BAM9_9BACT|nr:CHAT domain-containing protein [Desulfonema limicola]QTA82099.1 Tetratricopeptide repeat-containing protein [Desulfonema limicola]